MKKNVNRRTVLATGAAALFAPAVVKASAADAGEVVYATYGGSWADIIQKAWFDPFTEKTGIRVRIAVGPDNGKIRSMVQAGRTEWDVVESNPDMQWIGPKEGLLEKLDFSVIDTSHFVKGDNLLTDYSIPEAFWSRVIVYRTDKLPNGGPKDFAEFWDTERFPGKRVLYAKANGAVLEAALLADGVAPQDLYPLDIDRAFAKLDQIKDDILWYDNNTQAMQFMDDGLGTLGLVPDGRAQYLIAQGTPLAIEFNQSLLTWVSYIVPKGAPNYANANKLLAHISSLEGQVAIGNAYTYGLVDERATAQLPPERQKLLTNGPQQQGKAVWVDEKWWGENQARVEEAFFAWRLT